MPSDTTASQKLSPEVIDLAVAELRSETAFYLEIVQAMMDGANLGAEQVQDKRLEVQEAGPTTDPGAAILMFALTLILEGTIAPAIASLLTRTALRPLLRGMGKAFDFHNRRETGALASQIRLFREQAARTRAAARAIPLRAAKSVREYVEACDKAAETLRDDLRGKFGAAKPIRDAFTDVTTLTKNNLVAAVKAPLAVQSNTSGTSTPIQMGTSPGVAVMAAAMADASSLRVAVVATHEALEAEIKRPDIKVDDVITILNEYRLDTLVDLGHIRDSFQLATETMIWAALYLNEVDKDILRNRRNSPALKSTSRDFMYSQDEHRPMKLQADAKITDYLLVRLRDEIKNWAQKTNAWTGTYRGFQRPTWGPNQDRTEKEDLLVSYLAWVADNSPKEFSLYKQLP